MDVGGYRLETQCGTGPDGTAYRAWTPDGSRAVEVRVLASARADESRWPLLCKRLRLAAMLEHPAALRVLGHDLESTPPWLALPRDEAPGFPWADTLPVAPALARAAASRMLGALAEAHRLGLVHGHLGPQHLVGSTISQLQIDFTGIEVSSPVVAPRNAALRASCQAPEASPGKPGDAAADVYGLGALIFFITTGDILRGSNGMFPRAAEASDLGSLMALFERMLAADPAQRPTARAAVDLLASRPDDTARTPVIVVDPLADAARTVVAPPVADTASAAPPALPATMGRFRLLEKLGQGSAGTVYRAEDPTDRSIVAIKVLRPDLTRQPEALRRFHKEARLLAEVNNPFVTNLLEVNEDAGVHYLVMEFVAGQTLGAFLHERQRLEETLALAIMIDVARALVDAHERGIVHRDIKPENILLLSAETNGAVSAGKDQPPRGPRVKLADFGLARHTEQSESLSMTADGQLIGTPLYMAPEQGASQAAIDVRADVYAMGATLYHLLAGRPPFQADHIAGVLALHSQEAPPPIQKFNPAVSDAAWQVIGKALEKAPEARYPGAGAFLRDLEKVLRGEPTGVGLHPLLPDSADRRVLVYEWTWDLQATPAQLWPMVSNTERLNRAIGLPAVRYTIAVDPKQGVRRFGQFRSAGVDIHWQEHPFEWIEGRRMGVLREYSGGIWRWLISAVEMTPLARGGTRLTHQIRVLPAGVVGRVMSALQIGFKGRRALDRVYRRIDATVLDQAAGAALIDAFETPRPLSRAQGQRLAQVLDELGHQPVDAQALERVGTFLAEAPVQEVARIRPLDLARRLEVDADRLIAVCLHGARAGLVEMLWDILCPRCRVSCQLEDTVKALRQHGRCEACQLDFELDFASSVEMIFRVHPRIRVAELGTYCVGGPVHSPHVVAQVRLAPSERMELPLALEDGSFRFRGPQLAFNVDFRVHTGARAARWDLNLGEGPTPALPRTLRSGRQVFAVFNPFPQEVLIRIERTAPRDALTAARAMSLALFRELFPGEILSPGQLISVTNLTFLATSLDDPAALYRDLGDLTATSVVHEHLRIVADRLRQESGALVMTVNHGALATFHDAAAAARVALDLPGALAQSALTKNLRLRTAVHGGPAVAATLDGRLVYFGSTVQQTLDLAQQGLVGGVLMSQTIIDDPQVAHLLESRGLVGRIHDSQGGIPDELLVHQFVSAVSNDK